MIRNKSYLVHFETRKKKSDADLAGPVKDLTVITCFIKTPEKVEVARGEVVQNYNDSCDCVMGRKIAFTKAIWVADFNRTERSMFWEEYKEKCRLSKNSYRAENKRLKEKIVEVMKENKKLKEFAVGPATG